MTRTIAWVGLAASFLWLACRSGLTAATADAGIGGASGSANGGAAGVGGGAGIAGAAADAGGGSQASGGASGPADGGAGIENDGATAASADCDGQPLRQSQAPTLFRDFVYHAVPTYNPASVFSVEEIRVPGAWEAMGIQLFSGGSVDDYGYVVNLRPVVTRACKLHPLTRLSSERLLSAVLVGSTLYFTLQAGSGINYSELGRISLSGGGLEILQGANYARADSSNLYLRESGGQIVVDLGDGMKFNSWTALQVFGWLRDDGANIVVVDAAGTVIPYQSVGGW